MSDKKKSLLDLSIIIVNFNAKILVTDTLRSVCDSLKNTHLSWEIIFIDNGSSDESSEWVIGEFPFIQLIKNVQNIGYAKANNQGINRSKGRYILLLNSDTRVKEGVLEYMVKFMDKHRDVGVSTCKVVLPNGEIDPACHRGFPTPWASLTYFTGLERLFPNLSFFSGYHLWFLPLNSIHEIDSCSGAFYLIRRKVVEEVGLLDEDYFMYGEDLDWSYRIKNSGWKIIYNPTVSITHLKKKSGRKNENLSIRYQTTTAFYETMKLFYRKHYSKRYPYILTWIILSFIDLKKIISLALIHHKIMYD